MIGLRNLVRNENMKIYGRLRTWIMIAILVLLMAALSTVTKYMVPHSQESWEHAVRADLEQSQGMLNGGVELPGIAKEELSKRIAINQYRLDHQIPPIDDTTVWGMVLNMSFLINIVTLFTVVIAADIVAGEFTSGTIKLLLIRPATRSKILLSKYISTVIFAATLLLVLLASSFVLNGFLYRFNGAGAPYLYTDSQMNVHEGSMLLHVLSIYGLKCVELVMIVTLAFMISTVFRSSSLAISLSLLLLFMGKPITMFLSQWSWGRFWLFANTDLTQYIEGKPIFDGMSLPASLGILAVYFLVFNAMSWTIFNRRDVAA